jgi:outer membrane receptor protein involved in Fe transport
LVLVLGGIAVAQEIEVPTLVMESQEEAGPVDTELNLVNLVQTAARGVTTVQEAPAIITIIPADELRDRGTENLEQALDRVPGWLQYGGEFNEFPSVTTRGNFQALLLLRDGVSMFDSMVNIATVSRVQPLETLKRIEVVTGPGGVLWGANSYLGVVNLITKDAEDVNGVEAQAGYGTGNGNMNDFRGYVMTGVPHLFGSNAKLFAHASFESYQGAIYDMPDHLFGNPLPQPNGAAIYGPITESDPARSMILDIDGKLTVGSFSFYWQLPFAERYFSLTFPGGVVRENLPEDAICPQVAPNSPTALNTGDNCTDPAHTSRKNELDFFERYGIAEFKTRFDDDRAGLTAKGYFIQFVRKFEPLQVLSAIPGLLEGGLAFDADFTSYRVGGSLDGDAELSPTLRLIYGAEAFHEWLPTNTSQSLQGSGIETDFTAPYDFSALPILCPRSAQWNAAANAPMNVAFVPGCPQTFAFAADRTVLGVYADVQWRPTQKLILDAGIRGQMAPFSLGTRGYDPTPLGQAAVVYEFIPDWHAKLNFTQGIRPPVFNNTDSNAQGVQIAGNPDLQVETSTAIQSEVNARLLKGRQHIRELDLRADYSYTYLNHFIVVDDGTYVNGEPRAIQSAEFLAKLYLKGDHRLELGYTWLQVQTADNGTFRAMPEHWFNVGGVFTVIPKTLELNGTLRVIGAFEDPNLRIAVNGLTTNPMTGVASPSVPGETIFVQPTEEVFDKIPASAELQLGVRYRTWQDKLTLTATAYNILNTKHYQPDPFYNFEPRTEYVPNPYEGFRFFMTATVQY